MSQDRSNEENRRQYLAFIQDAINRMARSSALIKSWSLTVISAIYGLAFSQGLPIMAVIGVLISSVFMFMDAKYLQQEREFRELFKKAVDEDSNVPTYSFNLDFCRKRRKNIFNVIKSWSIGFLYSVEIFPGVFYLIWFACSVCKK